MREFGARLRELRHEKELSTKALGRCVGVSDTTICRWENCVSDIKSDELVRLAKFFRVSTDYLVGLED